MDKLNYKIPISVLVVIHTQNRQVLMIERANKLGQPSGFWQSVTGSINALNEALAQAAQREVFEETGIDCAQPGFKLLDWQIVNNYPMAPEWLHRYEPGVTHNTEHVFGLLVPNKVQVQLNPREHVAYDWLDVNQAANKCFSASNAAAISRLLAD
jgi:dihydroneopterin triphosphate diphosphatase